jgi:hypothetical protein
MGKSLKNDPLDVDWRSAPAIRFLRQKFRTKLNKGLIENDNPSTFIAGNAPPLITINKNVCGKYASNPISEANKSAFVSQSLFIFITQ